MTATVIHSVTEYREVSDENNKMLDYSSSSSNNNSPGGLQLTSVPCSSANLSCIPSELVMGASSPSHSVSLPSTKFSLKTDPSVLLGNSCKGNNKDNFFRARSYSELGDRLRPGDQACVAASSQVNSSRYKTELCRPFEENGTCKYGDKCQFAHGMRELRSLCRHPKYKTELCRTFHTIGFCPYGPRCHFIHNADECRGLPPLSAFNKMERPRLQHSFSFAGFPSSSGLEDSPSTVTPPPVFSTEDLTEWQSNPFTVSSQELASMFGPSSAHPLVCERQGLAPPSPTTPCFFQPTSERPPRLPV
ncbi:putative zinc finger protein 36 C3H1 type-like 1 [Scophthalmus maximus]|uniref:mRNA decay activator protein ZFP36 n=2 Tax=Scophthalmus maximus TaxID=52904 RepID=A0A2U9CUS2_SCOMX|nr:putative zinc finger protein 36 C3H1 type-like 1 [Scophthalmus maximus]